MTELELGPLRFGIVGAGRLGCAIGSALQRRGLELVHASSASPSGRSRATHLLDIPVFEDIGAVLSDIDCVIVAVPDDAVEATIGHMARRAPDASPLQLRVVSTSGIVPLDRFAPVAAAGHLVCGLHPVVSISEEPGEGALAGGAAATFAGDPIAETFAHALAHALDMHPFAVAESERALHSAACSAASGFTVSIQLLAAEFARAAGMHEGIARAAYGRLAETAVARFLRDGPGAEIPGPVGRGDRASVRAQLEAVAGRLPHQTALTRALFADNVRRAHASGQLDDAAQDALADILFGPSGSD